MGSDECCIEGAISNSVGLLIGPSEAHKAISELENMRCRALITTLKGIHDFLHGVSV